MNDNFMDGKPFAIACSCLLGGVVVFMWWGEAFYPQYLDWIRYFFS